MGSSDSDYSPAVVALPREPSGQLMGLAGPVSDMSALLTSRAEPIQAVNICGPAGIGKLIRCCLVMMVHCHSLHDALIKGVCRRAGKATLALATARHMLAQARWDNAYFADLRMCVSASEAGFQLLSGRHLLSARCLDTCHAYLHSTCVVTSSLIGLAYAHAKCMHLYC